MIVLMGKSSSGKDRILNELIKKHEYKKVVRYTTRPRRKGEKDGDTYHYISVDDFKQKIHDYFFVEWKDYSTVEGIWYYGTSLEDVKNADDKTAIILPPDRYKEVKNTDNKFTSIYIYANNATLKNRLNKRGDNKEEAKRRLEHDNEDFKGAEYLADKIVYNNDGTNINDVVNKILEFIGAKNE